MSLARASLVAGLLLCLVGSGMLLRPGTAHRLARRFPRSRWAGVTLSAADILWVTLIIHNAPLGRFEYLKAYLIPAALIAFLAVIFLMDELLAPRALGGLLLLAGNPVLQAARWHPSPWRLVIVGLVYLWVIAGMWLILSPWRFRLTIEKISVPHGIRIVGGCSSVLGAFLILLALVAY